MAQWIDVAPKRDFPPGEVKVVDADDGRPIAIFNVDGRYYAIEDRCSHEDECLSLGVVEDGQVVCPRHGARFSLTSGQALTRPAYEPVATFAVRVEAGMVQVDAEPGNPTSSASTIKSQP